MENQQLEEQTNVIINIDFYPESFQGAEQSLSFEQKGRNCILRSGEYRPYLVWKIE
jgi:hypothetical protein